MLLIFYNTANERVKKMHSVFEIALWFTNKNKGSIASTKLQKLCYYAQAWSYAINNKQLFNGDFEAWVHGPVNRQLWSEFHTIAYRDIGTDDFNGVSEATFEPEEKHLLELVWNTYGGYSGYQLEALTHTEKPWREQRVGLSTYEASNNVISPESMKKYYRSILSCDGVN